MWTPLSRACRASRAVTAPASPRRRYAGRTPTPTISVTSPRGLWLPPPTGPASGSKAPARMLKPAEIRAATRWALFRPGDGVGVALGDRGLADAGPRGAEPHVDRRADQPQLGVVGGDDPHAGLRIGLGRVQLEDQQRALLDGHAGLAGRGQERGRRVVDPLDRPRDVELALTGQDRGHVRGGDLAGQAEAGSRVVREAGARQEEGQGPELLRVARGARNGVVVALEVGQRPRGRHALILVPPIRRDNAFAAATTASASAASSTGSTSRSS